MKVYEYINEKMGTKKQRYEIKQWMQLNRVCPKHLCERLEIEDDPILYKMALECCEDSMTGKCIKHFLEAELGDILYGHYEKTTKEKKQ